MRYKSIIIKLFLISGLIFAQGKKIFISADLEGVVGAVTGEQLGPGGFEYNRFREFMTDEVNAAIKAANNLSDFINYISIQEFFEFQSLF